MPENAQSVFARQQPKPRMRQQRNNSVAPAPEVPADGITDEAQLSIVPDGDEPTLDGAADAADAAAASDPAPTPNGAIKDDEDALADSAPNGNPTPAPQADSKGSQDAPPDTQAGPEANEPAPEAARGSAAADAPAQDTPAPTQEPAPAKKGNKGSASKSRTAARTPASSASDPANGTALAVINPDGSVTVDPGTHLVDLRDVATQDDPHALVDMLGALRSVTDGDLRQHVTAEISAAITNAALRN